MAGTIVRVIPPRLFDFTSLALNQTLSMVLRQGIDVSQWQDASLMVRVSDVRFDGFQGQINVGVQYESLTTEDPGMTFVQDTYSGILLDGNTDLTKQAFFTSSISAPLGNALRVNISGTRNLSGTGVISAVLGIDIKLTNFVWYYT